MMTVSIRGHFQTTFANLNVIMTLWGEGVLGCDVSIDHKFRHAQEGAWHTSHAGKLIYLKTSMKVPPKWISIIKQTVKDYLGY